MIPGDIDLTENLDFRNVKKRNTPQLPSSWRSNNNDKINVSNNGVIYTIASSISELRRNFYYMENEYGDSTTITIRGIREVHNNRDLSWTYTTSLHDDFESTLYYWNDESVNYLTSSYTFTTSSSSLNVRFTDEPKYDVFGNRIKEPEQIPKFPWKFKDYTPIIHPIAWKRSCYKWSRFDEDYIPDIPWETEASILWRKLRPMNLSDYINKAKNLISWFNKKSSSFIERYFEDIEEVDTSYLTNMGWIRIHDAIID